MSDIPPTDESNPPPPPPPPGAAPDDEPVFEGLRRSRSDRVLAGVGGGLGHYFAIDPVIVRIGFVLLTIFGGSGILLYLLAWLVIAKEGRDETGAMRALRGSPEGNRGLLFLVLAVGAILIVTSPLVWFDGFGLGDGLALPLLLVAAGVAFLIWPGDDGWRPAARSRPAEPIRTDADADAGLDDGDVDDRAPGDAPISSGEEFRAEMLAARDEVKSELAEARASFRAQRAEWRHGYRAERRAQRRAARPVRPPKPAPFLGPLTVALLLVFAGVSMVGEQADWWDVDPAVYGGVTLAIIGIGLIVSAWFGRARGLIFAGIAVLPIAWAIAAIDLDWHDGVGEKTDIVGSVDELEDAYLFGLGDYEVDLSRVGLDGADRSIEVGLTIGELSVVVPETMNVVVDADARLGEIEVMGADRQWYDDEFDAAVDATLTGTEPGTLTIDLDVGIGAVDVQVCSFDADSTVTPCP
ncbi:MAG: PspC domain-containing protein [Actinomycetota bacterium]